MVEKINIPEFNQQHLAKMQRALLVINPHNTDEIANQAFELIANYGRQIKELESDKDKQLNDEAKRIIKGNKTKKKVSNK